MANKEIIASDETKHYENCVNCGGKGTLKVYECHFNNVATGGAKLLRLFISRKEGVW
ncbi:hypothetical protein [Desulfoscipio gibsoniae]|uniref:hypothetical protein n=1 Tax=Desulfoscipio gibsoniae TaxID=102134 RepID=UPI0012FECFE3|nr:hypothetical protein [Desulfoscipio gibsoniae]